MARTVLPIVGAVVGGYFGGPTGAQIGWAAGAAIGGAVDPIVNQGPKIGDLQAQTAQEGAFRTIIFGTYPVYGNVLCTGPGIKSTEIESGEGKGGPKNETEHVYRNFAIRICEAIPGGAVLRVWEFDKLVYDVRPGSLMLAESAKWKANKQFWMGGEDQLPDIFLELNVSGVGETPAYRDSCYMVVGLEDQTDSRGAISQYRFEVARETTPPSIGDLTASRTIATFGSPTPYYWPVHLYLATDGTAAVGTSYQYTNTTTGSPYSLLTLDDSLTVTDTRVITASGTWNGPASTVYIRAYKDDYAISVSDTGGYGGCILSRNGLAIANLKPTAGDPDSWWSITGTAPWELDARRIWFSETHVYVGTVYRNLVNQNNLCRWPLQSGVTVASEIVAGICATPGMEFFTHFGNDQKMRIINDVGNFSVYSEDLTFESSEIMPFSLSGFTGFGVDGGKGVFIYGGGSARMEVRDTATWALIKTIANSILEPVNATRVVFTDTSVFVQCERNIARVENIQQTGGLPMTLADIVSEIHDRCDYPDTGFDVSELVDEVTGFGLAGDFTGGSAIAVLQGPYNFDKSSHDGKLWYPKRGGAVRHTFVYDELVELPDTAQREQTIEYPAKLHIFYQHAASGYAVVKATSTRSSPDALVVGEISMQVPIVLNEDQAAQMAAVQHKIAWVEAGGQVTYSVPESFLKYTPADVVALSLRGRVERLRLEQIDQADGILGYTLKRDRQSAYTSNLTGVPIPPPSLPPSTIVGETVLAVLDIPSRQDSEDDLNILYAVSGGLPAWYGAAVQRSVDSGANFSTVANIDNAGLIGTLLDAVPAMPAYLPDLTSTVRLELIRDGQVIEDISETEFLSEGGAFALQKADGSWEILQYRDVVQDSNGAFILSTLHRGLLESGASAHLAGALFVMMRSPTHVVMPSSLIGQSLVHRAVSYSESPETAAEQTATYLGRSQTEWTVAYLTLTRSGNVVTAIWTPRYRFGTDDAPVNSANMTGYRVSIAGTSTVTFDITTPTFTYDVSAIGGAVTVSVSALNRITGAGPSTSGAI